MDPEYSTRHAVTFGPSRSFADLLLAGAAWLRARDVEVEDIYLWSDLVEEYPSKLFIEYSLRIGYAPAAED